MYAVGTGLRWTDLSDSGGGERGSPGCKLWNRRGRVCESGRAVRVRQIYTSVSDRRVGAPYIGRGQASREAHHKTDAGHRIYASAGPAVFLALDSRQRESGT